jgi:hypothetical protein
MVIATILLFVIMLAINEWLFKHSEFVAGINWVYLPAGMRLLCTLLFGGAGAFGLLIVSWLVSFFYFFPNDFVRAFAGGIIATIAPYAVYLIAQRTFGLHASLVNLTPGRLLICIVAYSLASPLLHHIWFAIHGDTQPLLHGFIVMFVGDLNGTLLVVYAVKLILRFVPVNKPRQVP